MIVTGGARRGRVHAVRRSREDRLHLRGHVRDHQPRRLAPDADPHEPRGADEPGRDLRRPAVLELGLGHLGHHPRGADDDDGQGDLRSASKTCSRSASCWGSERSTQIRFALPSASKPRNARTSYSAKSPPFRLFRVWAFVPCDVRTPSGQTRVRTAEPRQQPAISTTGASRSARAARQIATNT